MPKLDQKPQLVKPEGSLKLWLEENNLFDDLKEWLEPFYEADNEAWQPNDSDKRMAWKIYTELRSRVTTQHLRYRDGQDEAALTSVYSLFQTVRDAADKEGPNCQVTAHIAFRMLNANVRIFTAKWHLRNLSGKLVNNDHRNEFRRELKALTAKLKLYEACFARIVGQEIKPESPADNGFTLAPLEATAAFLNQGNSKVVWKYEKDKITASREQRIGSKPVIYNNLCGLAISGGGIRSATFALGVSQKFAAMGLFKHFDYISSVSGGAYLSSLIVSRLNYKASLKQHAPFDYDPFNLTEHEERKSEYSEPAECSKPTNTSSGLNAVVSHLRDNGRYLLKKPMQAIALWVFGLCVNALLIVSVSLILAAAAHLLNSLISDVPGMASVVGWLDKPFLILGILAAGALCVIGFIVLWIPDTSGIKKKLESVSAWLFGGAVFFGVAYVLLIWGDADISECISRNDCRFNWTGVLSKLPFIVGIAIPIVAGGYMLGSSRAPAKAALLLASALAILFLFYCLTIVALYPNVEQFPGYAALIGIAIAFWLSQLDLNRASFGNYYSKGLLETYLQTEAGQSEDSVLAASKKTEPYQDATPYHLIGAAVNLPSSKHQRLNERNADLFLLSSGFCGSSTLGYRLTAEAPYAKINKSTAMLISGAAASPLSGRHTAFGMTPWFTLLNIRLGFWAGNPLSKASSKKPTPFLLWREFLGIADENSSHINLSDGGHIENLGVYELLKRRCRTIICIDGEADPKMEFDGLLRLIQLAKVDMDINIDIELDDLMPIENLFSFSHFALAKITYPTGLSEDHDEAGAEHADALPNNTGYLLYIKSSMTGNEAPHILDYQRKNSDFPHQPTSDQFFSEAQFESYRALGEHIAEDLFDDFNFEEALMGEEAKTRTRVRQRINEPDGMQWVFEHLVRKFASG